jgi:putative serine protease PepD
VRYQLARSLAAAGPGVASFMDAQRALAVPGGLLARGVTRSLAARLEDLAQAQGVELRRVASATTERPRRWPLPVAIGTLALVVLGLIFGLVWARLWPRPVAAPPARVASRPAAAASSEPVLSARDIAARVLPSLVSLRCADSVGAGCFVGPEDLLTNAHVLCADGATLSVRLRDGRDLPGAATRRDDALDLALVHVPGAGAAPLPLGDAGTLEPGDRVMAAGSPVGLEFSVSEGLVSNLEQALFGVAYVQTDAKINPGNSGGPLLDVRGRVVGIVSLKHARAEGVAFALPINYAYTGAQPFVSLPEEVPESPGFQAMLARAEQQNREVRGEIASLDLRAGLVGVRVDQYQRLVARVIQPARTDPGYTDVKFKLWAGDALVCTLGGSISEWKLVERGGAQDANERRVWAWLESNGLDARLFVGEAAMSWHFCPHDRLRAQGATLELEDANPEAAKLQLRYF